MKEAVITVTQAARNFADCISQAHYQQTTFVLLKNGRPVARIVPAGRRACTGQELAERLARAELAPGEGQAWHQALAAARKRLEAPLDKWT